MNEFLGNIIANLLEKIEPMSNTDNSTYNDYQNATDAYLAGNYTGEGGNSTEEYDVEETPENYVK